MTHAMLTVRNLRKRYGPREALAGLSFAVSQGELFGLLGPNGAGKSTLMAIVAGLLSPDSGQVELDGSPFDRRQRARRQLIGIVPQDLAIYAELTARENLMFFGSLYGLGGAALRQQVREVLEAVALLDRADQRAATFSGGMKRRLNLGAALVHRPKLLLLDEPTTGVDPQSRNYIFEEIRRLSSLGMTIVYTSHYMEEVQALCPRVGIMDEGRLVRCDEVSNLRRLLPGRLRLRFRHVTPELMARLALADGCGLVRVDEHTVDLQCQAVSQVLFQVISLLTQARVEPLSVETSEPNLEDVFLKLTGHALRD